MAFSGGNTDFKGDYVKGLGTTSWETEARLNSQNPK